MSTQLPKLTFEDLEVTYCRKRKHSISSSSTGSSGNSSPSSSATSCSNLPEQPKKSHTAAAQASIDDSLSRKRTLPSAFCPKQKKPTNRFQPTNVKVSKAPKTSYVAKPLQHMPRRPLVDSNKNMMAYREFRELEKQKAQAAKLNGAPEEPPMKKRAQRRKYNN